MQEIKQDLWSFPDADALCITTNGTVKRNGQAVMGRGCAREAAQRFPHVPSRLGTLLNEYGNRTQIIDERLRLVAFPVKHHWFEQADLALIQHSAKELVTLADTHGWTSVVLPRPGCGNGQRTWEEVAPLLTFLDDRFMIVSR